MKKTFNWMIFVILYVLFAIDRLITFWKPKEQASFDDFAFDVVRLRKIIAILPALIFFNLLMLTNIRWYYCFLIANLFFLMIVAVGVMLNKNGKKA